MTYCVGCASSDVLLEVVAFERGRRRRRRTVITGDGLCRPGQSAGIEVSGRGGRYVLVSSSLPVTASC